MAGKQPNSTDMVEIKLQKTAGKMSGKFAFPGLYAPFIIGCLFTFALLLAVLVKASENWRLYLGSAFLGTLFTFAGIWAYRPKCSSCTPVSSA